MFTKTSKSPRPAPTITLKANWRKDWNPDAEAAASSSSQTIKPNQLANTGQPVILKCRASLDQQKKEEVEEIGQAGTGKPVIVNNGILDFRIQRLLHSKVEQSEEGRVRELVSQIEAIFKLI